jgi:N-acetyl-gamma-glutamyl-phosphate reductase
MKHLVFVDGQEGTTGLRIHEYLASRDDIEVLRIDADQRKDVAQRARLLNEADVAFLCLPDVAAREAAALVVNPRTCLIDASTAHRTAQGWVFGLPELAAAQREALRSSKRIANPGCHATAFILLVRPLVDAGLLPATAAVTATSLTGYSGGGKKMIEQYEAAESQARQEGRANRLAAPRPYALGLDHKHLPEMMAHTGLAKPSVFLPVVGGFYKGLTVSAPLHVSQLRAGTTPRSVHEVLSERYAGERFVRVLPFGDPANLDQGFFDIQGCNGTNRVDLAVFASAEHLVLMSRLDNLGKGASGAAVQSMNVHLGLEESLGL